ncbi:MAG: hypothetical protein IT258_01800 [Saprospiraceae bacterium]|nr:hypothetical protein [Saprospiraceae bacterium]
MKKTIQRQFQEPEFSLSTKEKFLEFTATAMCFLLLFASFLKVIFF